MKEKGVDTDVAIHSPFRADCSGLYLGFKGIER